MSLKYFPLDFVFFFFRYNYQDHLYALKNQTKLRTAHWLNVPLKNANATQSNRNVSQGEQNKAGT